MPAFVIWQLATNIRNSNGTTFGVVSARVSRPRVGIVHHGNHMAVRLALKTRLCQGREFPGFFLCRRVPGQRLLISLTFSFWLPDRRPSPYFPHPQCGNVPVCFVIEAPAEITAPTRGHCSGNRWRLLEIRLYIPSPILNLKSRYIGKYLALYEKVRFVELGEFSSAKQKRRQTN